MDTTVEIATAAVALAETNFSTDFVIVRVLEELADTSCEEAFTADRDKLLDSEADMDLLTDRIIVTTEDTVADTSFKNVLTRVIVMDDADAKESIFETSRDIVMDEDAVAATVLSAVRTRVIDIVDDAVASTLWLNVVPLATSVSQLSNHPGALAVASNHPVDTDVLSNFATVAIGGYPVASKM